MVAEELMTPDPEYIDGATTVDEAAQRMRELNIRHLPIVYRGQVVGMISDRDLNALLFHDLAELASGAGSSRLNEQVGDVMASDVIKVFPETDISDVIEILIEHKVGAVPVVSERDGTLMGIISYIDVLTAAQDSLS